MSQGAQRLGFSGDCFRVFGCGSGQEESWCEVDVVFHKRVEKKRAGGSAVVLGFYRPDHLGSHHPDQTGFGECSNMMPDSAFGFAESVSQLLDCRRAFVEQVDDLTSGVFEQCPVLGWPIEAKSVGEVVIGDCMVGHSRMVGYSRPLVKLLARDGMLRPATSPP